MIEYRTFYLELEHGEIVVGLMKALGAEGTVKEAIAVTTNCPAVMAVCQALALQRQQAEDSCAVKEAPESAPVAVVVEEPETTPAEYAMAEKATPRRAGKNGKRAVAVREAAPAPEKSRKCAECGQEFEPKTRSSKLCSQKCAQAYYDRAYREKKRKAQLGAVDDTGGEPTQSYQYLVVPTGQQANDLSYAIQHNKIPEGAEIRRKDGQVFRFEQGRLRPDRMHT